MEKYIINNRNLREFVEFNDLRNKSSVIHFNGLVTIQTEENKVINQEMEIMISFSNYNSAGQIILMKNNLDPYLFPTVFEASWQKIEFIDNEYLLISDTHSKNKKIGTYTVKIISLGKLSEW